MKIEVTVNKRDDGFWQADTVIESRDYHAVGNSVGDALVELGLFIKIVRKTSDLETLARVMIENKDG